MSLLTEIPYRADSARLFAPLASRPWACFLDSGRLLGSGGRYDLLAADPFMTLSTRGARTEVRDCRGVRLSPRDPFALLREHLQPAKAVSHPAGLPFRGGAIGWFGYDLGRRLERLPMLARDA